MVAQAQALPNAAVFQSSRQFAAPGDLDTTFGNGGKVVKPITPFNDRPTRVRIQPDGKIITVGYVNDNDFGFCGPNSFLVRHNADGTIDNSFGSSGSVVLTNNEEEIWFEDFVILPDGKFLVTGIKVTGCGAATALVVYRYTADGAPDTTFGTNGIITTPLGDVWKPRIVLQPDGKFVVASAIFNNFYNVVVVRYNPNGTLDTSFGSNGTVETSLGSYSLVSEILLQTDGKLLVAGSINFDGRNILILRYNPDGKVDNTFGANGIVQTDIDNLSNGVGGMILQPDGKIIVNGTNFISPTTANSNISTSMVRYNANGTIDDTFGTNGIVKITESKQTSSNTANALAIQRNGKILTAGRQNGNFAVFRYDSNGTADASFGTNGAVITAIGNSSDAEISSIALQTDGKIVAAGTVNPVTDVGLVRCLGDSVNASRTRFDFDGDGKADIAVFRPSDRVWYLLRSQAGFAATQWGLSNDKLVPADYDGDGQTDIAIFRDGVWYRLNSSDGSFTAFQFGAAGDVPVPADFTGDGRAELAVYRAGAWLTWNLANNQFGAVQFGVSTDKPVPADFDGDGKTDFAVYRDGDWYYLRSSDNGFRAAHFGLAADKPTVGDYDGDGKADLAVYRSGVWYISGSAQGIYAFQFGIATDIPVAADYDGDGKTDAAVYRDGFWYLLRSQQGFGAIQFGSTNDKPLAAAYVP